MIEIQDNALEFTFPEVHAEARLRVDFQRTLRIPDDGRDYPLPPGLGRFPLRHVDDFDARVPAEWIEHGGVMLPMYQAEALWLHFSTDGTEETSNGYPFAVKVAAGRINAVTGGDWSNSLHSRPRQDYMVVPEQPWLDGYCIEEGVIRQFVAMPLGAGYSAEEQITGKGAFGGLQIMVFPMRREVYDRRFPERRQSARFLEMCDMAPGVAAAPDMGLAPGGRMRQKIHRDPFRLSEWDTDHAARCFVHITNSMVWRAITESDPPGVPLTAAEYGRHGLPWFDHYSETPAVEGSGLLAKLKSVLQLGQLSGDRPLPENESTEPEEVIVLGSGKKGVVREWDG